MSRSNIILGIVIFVVANSALLFLLGHFADHVASGFNPIYGDTTTSRKAGIFIMFNVILFVAFFKIVNKK